ncbi:T9SS type A sorting domain-containing protein [bacterium]|nr:T9SS type A sorting domain-containing protein [bacterium]
MVGRQRYKLLGMIGLILPVILAITPAAAQIPIQIIHNSPDPVMSPVDVYIDSGLVLDDMVFKQASPFVDQFGVPVILVGPTSLIEIYSADGLTLHYSESLALTLFAPTLVELVGLETPGNFDPNPNGLDTSLDLLVYEGYKPAADNPVTAEMMAVHASPDLGAVDILVRVDVTVPGVGVPLFTNLQYGDMRPYIVLSPSNATLDLVETGTSNVIRSWGARFGLVVGAGVVGHAAGLQNPPTPDYQLTLFGAVASGFVFELSPVSMTDVTPGNAPFVLRDNYPNPFNPNTTIPFTVREAQHVALKVYDSMGRLVETLVDGELGAGDHIIPFQAEGLASGQYLYELRTARGTETRSMTLVK